MIVSKGWTRLKRADTFRSRGVTNETDAPDVRHPGDGGVATLANSPDKLSPHFERPAGARKTVVVGEYPSFSSFSQLCTVIHLNLAYRWFCRLGLDGGVPDHSTFSKNRHGRFRESEAQALLVAIADAAHVRHDPS